VTLADLYDLRFVVAVDKLPLSERENLKKSVDSTMLALEDLADEHHDSDMPSQYIQDYDALEELLAKL
jgi:hypothetical protein